MSNYARDITTLKSNAVMWWPKHLREENRERSIIPKLLATQDDFIAILRLSKTTPTKVFDLVQAAEFPANLFLKHLVVLSDYGGEPIKRLGCNFTDIFTNKDITGKPVMNYVWRGRNYQYIFESMPVEGLGNKKLDIDRDGLQSDKPFDSLKRDMTMILLHASASDASEKANFWVCCLGSLLGNEAGLEHYVKQRYIVVSQITSGANANSLGQLAQNYIVNYIKERLGDEFNITNRLIKFDNDIKPMNFDIVVTKGYKSIGIEVSFQETSNSTIERKSRQASDRRIPMNSAGHKIAYVIDGAGNFDRPSAISRICEASDCTVAYSDSEFDILVDFIRESLL